MESGGFLSFLISWLLLTVVDVAALTWCSSLLSAVGQNVLKMNIFINDQIRYPGFSN